MSKDAAKRIRKALKAELGLTSKDVSVRSSRSRHDRAVTVTIRRVDIDRTEVTEVANRERYVQRCEVSHEVLAGGNVFVTVTYDDDAIRPLRDAFFEALQALGKGEETTVYGVDLMRNKHGEFLGALEGEAYESLCWNDASSSAHAAAGLLTR
jgi:hypothetical protein